MAAQRGRFRVIISIFCFLLSASIISNKAHGVNVEVDNILSNCIDIFSIGFSEREEKLHLDSDWKNHSSIADCGCKSAVISYEVRLGRSNQLISFGVISSFKKAGYSFLINPDANIKYKQHLKLSINCGSQ